MILTLSAPVLYALELTPACTNRCAGCFNVFSNRSMPPLPLDCWQDILARIRPHAHRLKLTGGEPTLYPEFAGLVALLDRWEMRFSLFTNARWTNPAHIVRVLAASTAFCGLLVSLHGATAQAHEAFSGSVGSFAEAVANIRHAVNAGLPVALSTVIHRHNLAQLEQMPALCAELGADHVSFNRYLGPSVPEIEPRPDELKDAILRIEKMREQGLRVKLGNCVPHCFVASSSVGCLAGVAYCTIDPWGNLRPCNHSPTQCGNLLQESVESIWQGRAMEQWRARIPADCHRCAAFGQCHGGCHAQAELLSLPTDPLMGAPLAACASLSRVELDANRCPLAACEIRQESFGYVLLRGNRLAPLATDDLPIVQACDGKTPLHVMNARFGQRGLQVIYALYRQGLLDMQD